MHGDIDGLYAGRSARLLQSCRITRELIPPHQALVITGTPLGVAVDEIIAKLFDRSRAEKTQEQRRLGHDVDREFGDRGLAAWNWVDSLPSPVGLFDLRDETSGRDGTRIVVVAEANADLDALDRWVRGIWPVTIETTGCFPGGISGVLRTCANACRVDRSGLEQLARPPGSRRG